MGNYNSSEHNNRFAKLTKRTRNKFKQRRAQGECLGIGSRRRTRQAAISYGELQISAISVDVRMRKLSTLKMYYRILNT